MTINDQLERRAERGLPRGAAAVWAGARHELRNEAPANARTSVWGLRAALALSAAALIVLAGMRTATFDRTLTPTESVPAAAPSDGGEVSANQPAPIFIDGMTMRLAHEPLVLSEEAMASFTTGGPAATSTRVYARSTDPYGGPVLGIDTLDGGGFRPWAANLTDAEFRSLTDTIVRDGESWGLADDSDLTLVAQFSDDPSHMVTNGWQFDFEDGANRATIQAEPSATVWLWASRMLSNQSGDEQTSVSPIQVLGHDGVLLGDDVLWESDGFVYRLSAGELTGDTDLGRPAEPVIDRLQVGDRADWNAVVNRAANGSLGQSASYAVALAAVAAWIIAALLVAFRRPRYLLPVIGLGLLGFGTWWALAPSIWLTVAMFTAVVIALFWLIASREPAAR